MHQFSPRARLSVLKKWREFRQTCKQKKVYELYVLFQLSRQAATFSRH